MSWRLDLRVAARALARSPGYLVTAVIPLAVGIGTGTAAFGVVDAVRFRALPLEQLAGVRVNALQILAFALVGLGLALVGIHGLLSYAVSRAHVRSASVARSEPAAAPSRGWSWAIPLA